MEVNFLSLGTLVLAAPCCAFHATKYQIYWLETDDRVFTNWFDMVTQIWYHTHRQSYKWHKRSYRLTHAYKSKSVLATPVMCTHQLTVLHWMNNLLIQKFIVQRSKMSLLFKNCSLVEVISILLIRFNKTTSFLLGRKCNEGNGVNEQNKHAPHPSFLGKFWKLSLPNYSPSPPSPSFIKGMAIPTMSQDWLLPNFK